MADSQENYEEKSEAQSDEEILAEARERFKLADDYWSKIYDQAAEDNKFLAGEQWNPQEKAIRQADGRPCLTVSRLGQFVQQLTNDQRQNRPSIKVSPVDDKADPDTAKVKQGLIRAIETTSQADTAYDTSFEGAVKGGFGFHRVVTEYEDPLSFNQVLKIARIHDPMRVRIDPVSVEPDGSDMNYGFYIDEISKDSFCSEYGDSKLSAPNSDWSDFGTLSDGWVQEKTVRIAEYYRKRFETVDICLLSGPGEFQGMVVRKSEIDKRGLPEGVIIQNTRKARLPIIDHFKINGLEILERTTFPGSFVPIIPVYGKESWVDGERILEGIIRQSKDSQRMYNYWVTCETEAIALAPKAPFIASEGQVPPQYRAMWENANKRPQALLIYKETSINGTPVPAPQRNVYEPPVQAITNARMQASEDIKATTGMYDAALGARSNEQSGKAIERRTAQAQTSNFHFIDNLSRSIRHTGRILLEAIPHIYDTQRIARIIGDEGNEELIQVNAPTIHKGENKFIDLSAGKYDVTVDVGPSFATKRQEAVTSMLELARAYPKILEVAGDLFVDSMDFHKSKEIGQRLKKTLPPGLAEEDPNQKPIPPEVQAQLQQSQGMIEQLTQQLNQANEDIRMKRAELESRERIATMQEETKAAVEMAKLESKEALEMLAHQVAEMNQRFAQLGGHEPIQDFNEPHPDQMQLDQTQPTGGFSPGTPMEGL